MNPFVVISTHNRKLITTANIRLLQAQSVRPDIVVVVSEVDEAEYYCSFGVHITIHPNHPLGAKWQAGVEFAKKFMPTHLIITGSDDILAKGFVERVCLANCDFTGLRKWYVLHDNKLFLFDYLAPNTLPLGGGRCYSRRLLDRCDWKIFDVSRDRLLDDHGYELALRHGSFDLIQEPLILAVKGDWGTMNPFSNHLKSRNAKLVDRWMGNQVRQLIKEKFDYEQ